MNPAETLAAIQSIIIRMIEVGLSNQQNFPVMKDTGSHGKEIGIAGAPDLAISMKDESYTEIYAMLDQSRAYHIRMIDGALLQMCYKFTRRQVVMHRLCVFPAPHLENYDTDPDSYQNDELYADIVGKSIVHVPIRFDFDADAKRHIDVSHPRSHLTLGQYPNCRIPVTAPVSPARFIKFVLRNFYYTAFLAMKLEKIDSNFTFAETLTNKERAITHVTC